MDLTALKIEAARAALAHVEDGMRLGIGTGSTAEEFVRLLAERVEGGLKVNGVPTSERTAALCLKLGVPLASLDDMPELDLAVDGTDEIDPQLALIKGGGGALLREKIVGAASDRLIIIVDSSKPVDVLGGFPLPLEVLPFAHAWVTRAVAGLGADARLRRRADGAPFLTDQGNFILDADISEIAAPTALANQLDLIPGIIEHGLFVSEIDCAFIGRGDQVNAVFKSQCGSKS